MRIAVVGAGGVGGYLAHRLAAAGHPVAVIARGGHLEAIRSHGLTLEDRTGGPGGTVQPAVATDSGAEVGPVDLVAFAVKGQDLAGAIEVARPMLAEGGHALSLLNGVDGPGMLADAFGPDRALTGISRISAHIAAPGTVVKVTPFARFVIGTADGRQDRAPIPAIRALLEGAGVEAPDCPDVTVELWNKMIGLSALAAVTAGGRCDLATVRQTPELRALIATLMEEAAAVARARGVAVPDDAGARHLEFLDTLPGEMRASLAHDLAAGKPLEVDWLSGAVARLGAEAGVPVPAHATVAALLSPYRHGVPRG